MTEGRILAWIRDHRVLNRRFRALTLDERRAVLARIEGEPTEGSLLGLMKKVRRGNGKSENRPARSAD